jgi:hypothetical protein
LEREGADLFWMLKFHYFVRKELDYWPIKVMFWELKMTALRTTQGIILRRYTLMLHPEPTPKRIRIKWV